jgi:hypothetical protein
MKQVISASRRTDIPAFYLKWFMQIIREQKVQVINPFNRKQIREVLLSPREVAWIVFWSRNYGKFLQHLEVFHYYQCFFHFTINPAHKLLEPDMISPEQALIQLEKLVKQYGPAVITWRYDPLVHYLRNGKIESNHCPQYFENFTRIVGQLGLKRCYISLVFLYPKIVKRAKAVGNFDFIQLDRKMRTEILQEMTDIASIYGIQVYSCSNDALLDIPGIHKGRCIDGKLLNQLGPGPVSERKNATRPDCGCTASVDIGDYLETPCKYHCLYCYARR